MLTEKLAWWYLASKWYGAKADEDGDYFVAIGEGECEGLCCCVTQLLGDKLISEQTADAMRGRLEDYREVNGFKNLYLWTMDWHGAQERTKFCKTQGGNLTEKEAWTLLSFFWTKPVEWGDRYVVEFANARMQGLCTSIDALIYLGAIVVSMAQRMSDSLPKSKDAWGYCWPRTERGAELRSEFCKTQGDKCS